VGKFSRLFQAVVVNDDSEISDVARQVADVVLRGSRARAPLSHEAQERAERRSQGIADDIRRSGGPSAESARNAVFLVHGHDLEIRDDVERHLRMLGVEPVILSKMGGGSRSLLDRFETLAFQARVAVVLLSGDDVGASRRQYEDTDRGGEKTLKFRARENVILALGFFYGKLGWENVFVVQRPPEHSWPDFERPSDLAGVEFFEMSGDSDWRAELAESLGTAGLLQDEIA